MRRTEAQRIIRDAAAQGRIAFSRHAQDRLAEREVTLVEAVHALATGPLPVEQPHSHRWLCRSSIHEEPVTLVVAIEMEVVVVTAWRRTDERP